MSPKLFRVILPVSDIGRAAAFYQHVLGIEGRQVSPGRFYLDCEGTILACFDPRADGDGREARPNPEHMYFAVDDLEAVYRRVQEAGGTLATGGDEFHGPLGKIHRRPWGERSFYADDPFGNQLCFVERGTMFTG
jgi:predicted enzyme related to lactoylglutathione lyase